MPDSNRSTPRQTSLARTIAMASCVTLCAVGIGSARVAPEAEATTPSRAASRIEIGIQEPPVKLINSIRLTTYNILNLFDEVDDPALSGDQEDMHDSRAGLRAKPDPHCRAVADAIRRLDTDILALQEVESEQALRWFRDTYLADMGYEHIASIDAGDGRGIEQSVLSRFPIVEARVWRDLDLGGVHPDKFGDEDNWFAGQPLLMRRSPLRVIVRIPATDQGAQDLDIALFVVHHKSGRHSAYWREAEAKGVVGLVRELERERPGVPVVVLGDFNAMPTDQSMFTYYAAGIRDAYLKMRDQVTAEEMTHESRRAIDFILVNDEMLPHMVRRPPFVLGTPIRERGADWRGPAPEGYASDHMPLSIDLFTRNRGPLALPEGFTP